MADSWQGVFFEFDIDQGGIFHAAFTMYSPTMIANNDSISLFCDSYPTVNVLANDSTVCATPVVSIITNPSLTGVVSASMQGSNIRLSISQSRYMENFGKKDSLQYEIACGNKKDTGWLHISIEDVGYNGFTITEGNGTLRIDMDVDIDDTGYTYAIRNPQGGMNTYKQNLIISLIFQLIHPAHMMQWQVWVAVFRWQIPLLPL